MRVLTFKSLIISSLSLMLGCQCVECLVSADMIIQVNCENCSKIKMMYQKIDTSNILIDTVISDEILLKNQSNFFEKTISLGNRFDGQNVYFNLYLNDSLIILSDIKTRRSFCSRGKRRSCGSNFGFEITELLVNGERKEGNQILFEL